MQHIRRETYAAIVATKVFVVLLMPLLATAQTAPPPLQPLQDELPSEKTSYAARMSRRGVRAADPNVYVYTPEFAKRFQMPQEWVSTELKGADAVAIRVVPYPYKTCGWGGNPNACRSDEVRCEMDLYFDHVRNPLPWDERMRPGDDIYKSSTSVWFLASTSNGRARYKRATGPLPRGPFIDKKSGKELKWAGVYWNSERDRGDIGMGLSAYDKEVFWGMAMITLGWACAQPATTVWLASENLDYQDRERAYKLVTLPQSWRQRVTEAMKPSQERDAAFFKSEGEKALKALRESPVPSQSVAPLQ